MKYLPLQKTKDRVIILVHGMGVHKAPEPVEATSTTPAHFKPGAFGKEFIDTSATLMTSFAGYNGKSLADVYDIHEVNYDVWFDQMRTTMADNGKSMSERLTELSGKWGTAIPFDLVSRLTSLEKNFKDDKFFYTHWLDVIFYATMLGFKVRADAAAVIADAITQYDAANVHIIAHSLGTAVVHDTLHALYQKDLNPVDHQIRSIWLFSNVSGLVNTASGFSNPLKTVVRPGDGGCCTNFVNVRHELDPFTWLVRFDPANNESWVPSLTYTLAYSNIVTNLIADPNTHSFPQYLQDPQVSAPLLKFLLFPDFKGTEAEIAAATKKRGQQSLPMKYAELEDELQTAIKAGSFEGWKAFLDNAKQFADAVAKLGGQFKT